MLRAASGAPPPPPGRDRMSITLLDVEQFLFQKTNKKFVSLSFSVLVCRVRTRVERRERNQIGLMVTSVLYNRRLRTLLFGDSVRARWDRFNMIDLFILHFKGAFLRLLVNLITKYFISGHVKFSLLIGCFFYS